MRLLAILAILSMLATGVMAQCDLPTGFTNFDVAYENDLKITFATDKMSYATGETVQFYFIVQNLGTSIFSINWGSDPQDGIFVLPVSCTSLTQTCFENSPFHHPEIVYYFSGGTTLDPGECRIWERSWDTSIYPATPATYNVLGGMWQPMYDDNVGLFHVPTTPILLTIAIDSSIPTEKSTWGQIKELYR